MDKIPNYSEFINEKTSFSQMKKDSKTKEYKEVSQAINNAEEVGDIWNMLDPKMFKFKESEFEDIFDVWWNNISSYDSIADFSRNASWEDAHSLYLHLLPHVSESVVTEANVENSEILDVIDSILKLIKNIKTDSSKKGNKLYTASSPLVKELHKLLESVTEETPVNEEYIELMQIDEPLEMLKQAWEQWRKGPMTEYEDVPPAHKELLKYVQKWLKKNLR